MKRIATSEPAPSTPLRAKYRFHRIIAELTEAEFQQFLKMIEKNEHPPHRKQ